MNLRITLRIAARTAGPAATIRTRQDRSRRLDRVFGRHSTAGPVRRILETTWRSWCRPLPVALTLPPPAATVFPSLGSGSPASDTGPGEIRTVRH